MLFSCRNCGFEETYEDEESARDNNWWQDDDGSWYCQDCHGYCVNCDTHIPYNEAEWSETLDGMVCDSCIENCMERCGYCEQLDYAEDTRTVIDEVTETEKYICTRCFNHFQDQGLITTGEMGEYILRANRQGNSMFQQHLHQEVWDEINNCPDCRNEEFKCPKCLRKMAKEQEEEETNLWVYDNMPRGYHQHTHNHFKTTKLREKHEHPFLYYGIENELLFNSNAPIETITQEYIDATKGLFVAEFDRSVTERGNGIEFISRPLSYKKWMDESTYQLLEAGKAVLEKYRAFMPQPDACGLHIHMSLQFFERNTTKSVKQIKSDIDWMFQIFQEEIEKISRRKFTRYCASKAFRLKEVFGGTRFNNYAFNLKPTIQLEKGELTVSAGSGDTHHDAIVQTFKTIEVRTFKATTITNELLGAIEFCRCIAHAARNINLTSKNSLGDILWCKDSKYLPEIIKKQKVDTDKKFSNKLEVKI